MDWYIIFGRRYEMLYKKWFKSLRWFKGGQKKGFKLLRWFNGLMV
jgi:hypothetical protein